MYNSSRLRSGVSAGGDGCRPYTRRNEMDGIPAGAAVHPDDGKCEKGNYIMFFRHISMNRVREIEKKGICIRMLNWM